MEETKNTQNNTMEGALIVSDNSMFASQEKQMFCTLDLAEKSNSVKLYNALQQCDVKINDVKGSVIEMKDVFIEVKDIPERDSNDNVILDEETGEVVTKRHFRTIIFDTEGKTYVSAAYGVYNSLRQIIPIFGNPSEDNIIKVKVGNKTTRTGKESLILTVVE